MFPFRKRILRKVDCRGLAVLERDLLEAVVGLSAATTTDLCIRWQLEELLGYQEEARRSDGAWFEREWVENYGRRGCYYELPAVKIVQVPQIGGRWSHPSVTLPRVWSYSVLTDKSRSLGLTLKMCGWIGEICLYGFERRELRYNYPVDTSCEVSPVVSSRSEPDVCVAVPDDRLRLLLDAVTATLSEHSKPKNRIIVSAPFTAETLGEYRLSRTVRSLFAFSNGMRINDLLIYELDGFMGVRHGYFDAPVTRGLGFT